MKLKKNWLGTILGIASVVSCLGGALLLGESVDVNAESQTSNLIYNLSADAFTLGGKNNSLKIANSNTFDKMVNGVTSDGAELQINADGGDGLYDVGPEQNVSITVDLGAVYNLKHFYMYSLNRQSAGWLIYDLSVSTDGEDYTLVADDVNEYSSEYVTTNGETKTASMDISEVGRYFRIDYVGIPAESTKKGDWMIKIYEMELYGYSLSSHGYEADYAEKTVAVKEGETVETVLSNVSVAGNATVQYCNANGEAVTDTTALAAEGDVIKVTDNMKSANTEAVAGCYDAANVSFTDTYTVCFAEKITTSNLMYKLPADAFGFGGNNSRAELWNSTSFDNLVDGATKTSAELYVNSGELKDGKNVSIIVDLGAVYNLKHFYMYSLQRYADGWLIYDLSVSTDGEDYTLVADDVNESSSEYVSCTNTERGICTASMDIDGFGRYFKLDYVGISGTEKGDWMIKIYEMELYGYALSSEEYEVDDTNKTITASSQDTVGAVLSGLTLEGNATLKYYDANGVEVTDMTRAVTKGDVIKVADNIETAEAGSYDAANVSFVDEYVVDVKAEIRFISISTAGDIGLNFYVYLGVSEGTYTATFSVAGETVGTANGVYVAQYDSWVFSYGVAPKDYETEVTIAVDGTDVTGAYSVKAYAEVVKNGNFTTETKTLVEKLTAYCEAARVYFAGEEATATADLSEEELAGLNNYTAKVTGSDDNIKLVGATLICESVTSIHVYFKASEEVAENVDGAVAVEDGLYVVKQQNIAAKDLNKVYTFTIGGYTVEYSALAYAQTVVTNMKDNVALYNVAKAIYAVSVAAENYTW